MLKTYNFWVKLIAVSILIFKVVGEKFGYYVDSVMFMDIATILASILVVLGVLQVPASSVENNKTKTKKESKEVKEDIIKVLAQMGEKIKALAGGFYDSKVSMLTSLIDEIVCENAENSAKNSEKTIENANLAAENENFIKNETALDSGKIEENEVVIGVENDAEVQTAGGTDTVIIEEELSKEEAEKIEEFLATNLNETKTEQENNLSQAQSEQKIEEDVAAIQTIKLAGVSAGQETRKAADAINEPGIASESLATEKSTTELETIIKEKIKEIIENNLEEILSAALD